MYTRASKVLLVCAVALHVSLVAFNNLTDFGSNLEFVRHVLRMDTTFPGNALMWRAIDSPSLQLAFYWLIIVAEAAIALCCWVGALRLFGSVKDPNRFDKAKGVATAGLSLGMVLWFTGFITVGGEWFLMWQSATWNGVEAAFRLVAILGIVLLYLVQPDGDGSARRGA
jgi:predicted small integral membrane protein